MLKLIFFFAFAIIGLIAYTGIDVTQEYDEISKVRNQALDNVFDPLTKKVLKEVSESELDQVVEKSIENYQKEMTDDEM